MMPYVFRRVPRFGMHFIPFLASLPATLVASQFVSTHALPGAAKTWMLGSLAFGALTGVVRLLLRGVFYNPLSRALRTMVAVWVGYAIGLIVAFSGQVMQALVGARASAADAWGVLEQIHVPHPEWAVGILLVPLTAGWIYAFYQARGRSFLASILVPACLALAVGTAPIWLYLVANAIGAAGPLHLFDFESLRALGRQVGAILASGAFVGTALIAIDLVLGFRRAAAPRWSP